MSRLWLPAGACVDTGSVTITRDEWDRLQRRQWLVGVCKCGHVWMMHYHLNPNRPGTSCDTGCGCKRYRFRRLRDLKRRRTLR